MPTPDYIGTKDAAKLMGVSRQRLHMWILQGRIPTFRPGNEHLIERSAAVRPMARPPIRRKD